MADKRLHIAPGLRSDEHRCFTVLATFDMLVVTMGKQPSIITPGLEAGHPLLALREQLRRLRLHSGNPSYREISRQTRQAISHTTVAAVLRCEKNPKWGHLEVLVDALGGDLERYRLLWIAAEEAGTAPNRVAADPGQTASADLNLKAVSRSETSEQSTTTLSTRRARPKHKPSRRRSLIPAGPAASLGVAQALDAVSPVKLYVTESGRGQPTQPLIVGAIEVEHDSEETEQRTLELFRRLSARRSLHGLASFDQFRKNGFQASTDPIEISGPFRELIFDLPFRAYLITSDRTDTSGGPGDADKLNYLYGHLLGDLLLRYRMASTLPCRIESGAGRSGLLSMLPDAVKRHANSKKRQSGALPQLDIVMSTRVESMSFAIID
ncbi:hypothetical protein AB0M46_27420 [Dactylosporangium sp. NPDC051485]|uniref:hypothetical protein n=1 Tax=Dactylosporangium sp. NPDC051485 TaxID=3154846 RepID=UPI0034303653